MPRHTAGLGLAKGDLQVPVVILASDEPAQLLNLFQESLALPNLHVNQHLDLDGVGFHELQLIDLLLALLAIPM